MAEAVTTKTAPDKGNAQVQERPRERPQSFAPSGLGADILALHDTAGNQAVSAVLRNGNGRPLDSSVRAFMESRFNHDFSQVRVHTDAAAAQSAEAVNAKAYTVGNDIIFKSGMYTPETVIGGHLLAHELTHVVQQQPGKLPPALNPSAAHEKTANSVANSIIDVQKKIDISENTGIGLAKQGDDQLTPAHAGGEMGERDAAFALGQKGFHVIVGPGGPEGHKLTTKGFDIVAYNPKTDELKIVDNKSSGGTSTVQEATAITKNLGNNLKTTIEQVKGMPNFPGKNAVITKLEATLNAIANGKPIPSKVSLVITNAGGYHSGISKKLKQQGIQFEDITGSPTRDARKQDIKQAKASGIQPGRSTSHQPTNPRAGGKGLRIGRQGGIGLGGLAKTFGPTILDKVNHYFIAKAESEKAVRLITSQIESATLVKQIEELVEKERINIARKQFHGDDVFVTVSMRLLFTNDVFDKLLAGSVRLTDDDQSKVTVSIEGHEPLFSIEKKVWYVHVSLPVESVELSKTEALKFRLDDIEQLGSTSSMDPREVAKLSQERNRLLDELHKAQQEEEKAKKEELEGPHVISNPKKRAAQQQEISDEMRRIAEKKKVAEPKKEEKSQLPPGPSLLAPTPQAPPPQFLPGAPGDSPVKQTTQVVQSAEAWANTLVNKGTELVNRLSSNNSPTMRERQEFLEEEKSWHLALKYAMNIFTEQSRREAVSGLAELLDRFGPKLKQFRTYLGGE